MSMYQEKGQEKKKKSGGCITGNTFSCKHTFEPASTELADALFSAPCPDLTLLLAPFSLFRCLLLLLPFSEHVGILQTHFITETRIVRKPERRNQQVQFIKASDFTAAQRLHKNGLHERTGILI